jgi:hypothetical protein
MGVFRKKFVLAGQAESQALLNTLAEHGFQDAFEKWQKRWKRCICVEVTTSMLKVVNRLRGWFLTRSQYQPLKSCMMLCSFNLPDCRWAFWK